jgi:ABC-type transport system involved in cytochrome c biogenesis permease subunit
MFGVQMQQFFMVLFTLALAGYLLAAFVPLRMKQTVVLVSAVCHVLSIALRTALAGRLPMAGVFDTLSFFGLCTALTSLFFYRHYRSFTLLEGGTVLAFLMLLSDLFTPRELRPLPPVLRTFWFEIHVGLSFVSYAFFAVGFLGGLDYFLSGRNSAALEAEYRANLWGYFLFSVAMIAGGIWAYYAWGTYWLWTPKELWTTIVWFFYSLYLHARIVKGWKESTRAVLAMAGFAVVLFTYVGVGLLMKSSHSF